MEKAVSSYGPARIYNLVNWPFLFLDRLLVDISLRTARSLTGAWSNWSTARAQLVWVQEKFRRPVDLKG